MIDSILTFCDEVLSNPVWFYIITLLIKIVICFAITILFIPVCVYIERRVAAWIQDRVGPNRAGIPVKHLPPLRHEIRPAVQKDAGLLRVAP